MRLQSGYRASKVQTAISLSKAKESGGKFDPLMTGFTAALRCSFCPHVEALCVCDVSGDSIDV